MLLYDSKVSGNCYKVRLLLTKLGLAFDREEVDVVHRRGREELLGALNPALRVPTLVLDDGRPLAESNAILWYFADGSAYLPEDAYARAQILQWLFFEQYSHEPYIAVVRFWVLFAPQPPPEEEIVARRKGGEGALAAMERHLQERSYLVGEHVTIADLALYALHPRRARGRFRPRPLPGDHGVARARGRGPRTHSDRRLAHRPPSVESRRGTSGALRDSPCEQRDRGPDR